MAVEKFPESLKGVTPVYEVWHRIAPWYEWEHYKTYATRTEAIECTKFLREKCCGRSTIREAKYAVDRDKRWW